MIKPMLAASTDGKNLTFPLLASPKLDGVRALVIDGVVLSRNLKPIPNQHVQRLMGLTKLNGLDGELIVGSSTAHDVYRATNSAVMSVDGEPPVKLFAFDRWDLEVPFRRRLELTQQIAEPYRHCVTFLKHKLLKTAADLEAYETQMLDFGYEGVMLRQPEGPYKQGRSTEKEAWLLKLKRFTDSEARILGVEELLHNGNEAKRNALGQLERSSHKAGKVGRQTLGALHVKDLVTGVEFDIGTGFDAKTRDELWAQRDQLPGKLVKYKSFPIGVKDKPRFPVFLGLRDPIDL